MSTKKNETVEAAIPDQSQLDNIAMTKEQNVKLQITRVIKAPRARVYAAWTDPEQLRVWFGPDNVRTIGFTGDVRVGGKYRWDLINPEGEEMTASGEYRELVPGKKIVFTWKWEDDELWENNISVVTIELADHPDGTELKLTHEKFPSTESRDNHNEGWNSLLDSLTKYFEK